MVQPKVWDLQVKVVKQFGREKREAILRPVKAAEAVEEPMAYKEIRSEKLITKLQPIQLY